MIIDYIRLSPLKGSHAYFPPVNILDQMVRVGWSLEQGWSVMYDDSTAPYLRHFSSYFHPDSIRRE